MIEALITGKLHGKPERRTSRSGKPFVSAKVRVPSGEDAVFVGVVAFSDSVQTALVALDDGEAVALAGTLSAKAWTDREGNARPGLDLIANQLLTVHHAKRKREAVQQQRGDAQAPAHPRHVPDEGFDDGGPDPWLGGDDAPRYGGTGVCQSPSSTSTHPGSAPSSAADSTTKRCASAASRQGA